MDPRGFEFLLLHYLEDNNMLFYFLVNLRRCVYTCSCSAAWFKNRNFCNQELGTVSIITLLYLVMVILDLKLIPYTSDVINKIIMTVFS